MKQKVLFFFIILFVFSAQASKIRMAFDYKSFYHSTTGNYIETYVQMLSSSVRYEKINGHYQGEVEIQIVISHNDTVAGFEKYRLKSAPIGDTIFEDFYSLKRFSLKPGDYLLEIYAFDVRQFQDTIRFEKMINIPPIAKDIQFSDVELIESMKESDSITMFTKSGYNIFPRLLNYYNNDAQKLLFYAELYNTHLLGDSSRYIMKYYISEQGKNTVFAEYMGVKRLFAAPVISFIQVFDIAELPTGEYDIVLELYNEEGMLIRSKQSYFDRYNATSNLLTSTTNESIIDPIFQNEIRSDSLFYYLMSLTPMSSRAEQENLERIVKEKDTLYARKYFQAYWRKTSPENTTQAWLNYKKLINLVEENYGSAVKPGFISDRGRVFIKYGVPNSITSRPNDPNQYPYEIWQYYKIDKRNNVRFVFYNPRIVGDDYQLLHSDLPNERYNSNWENALSIQKNGTQTTGGHLNDMNILNSQTNW